MILGKSTVVTKMEACTCHYPPGHAWSWQCLSVCALSLSPHLPLPLYLRSMAGALTPGRRITATQRRSRQSTPHPPAADSHPDSHSARRPAHPFTDKCSDGKTSAGRTTRTPELGSTLYWGDEMEREATCSGFSRGTRVLHVLRAAAEELSGRARERKASERTCSYPLLTPELCIPEVLVLSPFAMGEADTEE